MPSGPATFTCTGRKAVRWADKGHQDGDDVHSSKSIHVGLAGRVTTFPGAAESGLPIWVGTRTAGPVLDAICPGSYVYTRTYPQGLAPRGGANVTETRIQGSTTPSPDLTAPSSSNAIHAG